MSRFVAPFLLALVVAACGGDDDFEIAAEPLSGQVGGQNWTFVRGHTNAFLSEGESEFFATLYPEDFTTCDFGEPSTDSLIVSVPKETGEYEFSLSLNMTFVTGGENLVATEGVVRVDTVTDTLVTGGLHGMFDGDNEVSGTFEIAICADDET